jgi:hypothetical protein
LKLYHRTQANGEIDDADAYCVVFSFVLLLVAGFCTADAATAACCAESELRNDSNGSDGEQARG